MSFLSCCFPANVFTSSLLKDNFARSRILYTVFSLSTLQTPSHSLLAYVLSEEKADENRTEHPCTRWVIAHSFHGCLSTIWLWSVSWSSLNFLEVQTCFSSSLGNCQLLFLQIFFLPLSLSPFLLRFPLWTCCFATGPSGSLHFPPCFFLLLRLDFNYLASSSRIPLTTQMC